MADQMQVHLSARDDLTRDLKNAIKNIARLESQLRDLGDATDPGAERDVKRLTGALDKAYDKSKVLSGAVDNLDHNLDQMGASAKTAGDKTQSMGRDMDSAHRRSKSMVAGWGKMIGVVAGVTAAIGAASGAFRLLGDSVGEARQARKAMAQTAAVMRSMGRTEAPKVINKMVDHLESISGIDGDNLREMTNVLFTFGNVSGKTFEKANSLALDLSVAYGKDLNSAAVMVGKALNDPVKGLTALGRVGVQFTTEQQNQIKAMMEVNDVAGAQKIIVGELTRQVGGSAAAQADDIAKAQVAWGNLKEAVGKVLLSVGANGTDIVGTLQDMTKWLKKNKQEIVSFLQQAISVLFKFGSVILKIESIWLKMIGYIVGGVATTLDVLSKLDPSLKPAAEWAHRAADGFGTMSEKADRASKWMDAMSTSTHAAAVRTKELVDALKQVKSRKIRIEIRTTVKDAFAAVDAAVEKAANAGDTRSPWGTGPTLGQAGLASAHAGYAAALGGHQITSGIRAWGLGSANSDHLRGRAMDVRGPRLGSYAQAVRAAGGYAAFHGQGGGRHLHVVPRTHRPEPASPAGGDTLHAEVHFHGGAPKPFDVRTAVASGLRSVERSKRERGGR